MFNIVTHEDLIKQVSERIGLASTIVKVVLDEYVECMAKAMLNGSIVKNDYFSIYVSPKISLAGKRGSQLVAEKTKKMDALIDKHYDIIEAQIPPSKQHIRMIRRILTKYPDPCTIPYEELEQIGNSMRIFVFGEGHKARFLDTVVKFLEKRGYKIEGYKPDKTKLFYDKTELPYKRRLERMKNQKKKQKANIEEGKDMLEEILNV